MKKLYRIIIGVLFFLCLGDTTSQCAGKNPYMSADYLMEYIEKNHIDTYSFKEADKVEKYMNSCSEEPVFIEEVKKLGKQPYYGMTKDITEFLYVGQMKKNKPDGIGVILKPVDFVVESEEEGKAYITEYTGFSDEVYYARCYIGEFKGGRPEGYGIEFSVPGDDDYIMQPINIQEFAGDKIQEGIFASANPRKYEGKFKNGKYSGKGNEFIYMGIYWEESALDWDIDSYSDYLEEDEIENSLVEKYLNGTNEDIIIYSGNYKKGKKKGKFKVYEWGFLSYEGDMKGDVQSGRGKIYYPLSDQIQYEGELAGGEYEGEGTLYNEDGSIQYKGKWDMGDYAS